MSDKSPILTAKKRDRLGTRYAARVREAGGLPAVVYGHKEEPMSVALDRRDAVSHINKGEKVFKLKLDGAGEQMVLLKDVQFDHMGSNIVHADFARVSLTDRVTVKVPIHLVGEAKGLKNAGAILMHPTSEVDVECVVTEIPEFLEVNISELDLDHAILASELKLPKPGMKLKTDKSAMLAQIVIQQEIVEEKPEEAAVDGAAATEPEVLTAKKPKEGEEGAEVAKPGAPAAKGAAPAAGAKPGAAPAKGAAPAAGAKPAAGGDKKK
jgi:large subunit ribosomal protein L25